MSDPQATAETGIYSPSDSASELVRVLDQYLADLQAGRAPDKARLLAEHPELARQLEDCLAGIEFVHRAAGTPAATPAQLGDFRILREVGRGGMGVVYEAEQLSLKRKVALKVLRFGVTADPEVMQRFQREAETVAHLHHTNIVPIHAVGCEQGVHYYAMQFIEGQSLAAVADEAHGLLSVGLERFQQVSGWMLQAADALAHAHQRGVIHRDIKPSNLILDPEGTVWLTDFGLAKRADEVTMTAAGILMGTPRYMSPEQAAAAKQPIDHRTDIYSLGATLYELATGKPVFDSQTPQGVITQILSAEPVAPRLIQGKLPRDLETIILKCLAKEPARRYQQARDLADDLRAFLENRAIRGRRANMIERANRWAKKHRRSTAVSAVTAIASVLLIMAAYFGWGAYQESLLGRLSLTTDGPSLVAEVLDDHDELVIPSFPVPTPEPVSLRAGSYRVRLSGSGVLSETWQMEVERGKETSYPVKLIDRLLGPPLEVLSRDPPQLLELDGRTNLLVGAERGWRLINGATYGPVWANELKSIPETITPTDPNTRVAYEERLHLLQGYSEAGGYNSPATGQSPAVAQPALDLNADGKHDLVLAGRRTPALLAISGKDAQVLWLFRSAFEVPQDHDAKKDPIDPAHSWQAGGVVGAPITVDVGGKPAVVAAFASFPGSLRSKAGKELKVDGSYWLEAVGTSDGKSLWRTPIQARPGSNDLELKQLPEQPQVVELNGRQTLLYQIHANLFAFNLETGEQKFAYEVPFPPLQFPQFADVDGDAQPEALYLYRQDNRNATDELTLRAVALDSRETLWERPYLSPTYAIRVHSGQILKSGSAVTWPADVDRDGKSEVLIAVCDDWSGHAEHWFGVELLDGATGKARWQRRLWSLGHFSTSGSSGRESVRCLVGPDLDGDQHRELFVASRGSVIGAPRVVGQPSERIAHLQVEALSGADGRILWRKQHPLGEESPFDQDGRLQWWQADNDGWPQLVVPLAHGLGGQPITYIVSAANGQLMHSLPGVADPQVADINSDGIGDLFHLSGQSGSRRLTVFKGSPPAVWRRGERWDLAADFDRDGTADFREWLSGDHPGMAIYSGVDGRRLWQANFTPDNNTRPEGRCVDLDVDHDQVPDAVVLEAIYEGGHHMVLSAFSGRDGHRLWTKEDLQLQTGSSSSQGGGRQTEFSYPMLNQHDLDGDGQPEILLVAKIAMLNTFSLAALSTDGGLLWKTPILDGAYTGQSLIDRHLWHDLNSDGALDIVLWVPKSIGEHGVGIGLELRAISGRDGKSIWPQAYEASGGWNLWPRTAIADLDGDGEAEVVTTSTDGKGANSLVVLEGATGQKKWSWSGQWGAYNNHWPPLVVDADASGQRVVCLGVQEQMSGREVSNILVFDPQGSIRTRIPLQTSWLNSPWVWAAFDADGDGREELLYRNESQLHAYRISDERDLWERSIPPWFAFETFQGGPKGQSGTLLAWNDRTAVGLDTSTGATRWRCDVPRYDNYQVLTKVDESNRDSLPRIVSHDGRSLSTLVQRAWPTSADGDYQAPKTVPLVFPEYVPPIRYRPVPWQRDLGVFNPLRGLREPPVKAVLILLEWPLVLVFLGTLLRFMFAGRWRAVGLYLLLFSLLAAGFAALALSYLYPLEPDERYSWQGGYWILWGTAIPTGALTVLASSIIWLVRRFRSHRRQSP